MRRSSLASSKSNALILDLSPAAFWVLRNFSVLVQFTLFYTVTALFIAWAL